MEVVKIGEGPDKETVEKEIKELEDKKADLGKQTEDLGKKIAEKKKSIEGQ